VRDQAPRANAERLGKLFERRERHSGLAPLSAVHNGIVHPRSPSQFRLRPALPLAQFS
jgi:hypothetical protein